jgi:hypothetical protein
VYKVREGECADLLGDKAKKDPKKAKKLPFTRVPVKKGVEKVRE